MAVALLQPQQQQSNWFFVELEDDGGVCEVEVDRVGFKPHLCVRPGRD